MKDLNEKLLMLCTQDWDVPIPNLNTKTTLQEVTRECLPSINKVRQAYKKNVKSETNRFEKKQALKESDGI